MGWRLAALLVLIAPSAAAQTPPPFSTFSTAVDVVASPADLAKSQTLAPVDAIASRELDQFVPGAGFQGALRLLSTVMPAAGGGVSIKGGLAGQTGIQLGMTTLVDPASGIARVALPDDAIESVSVLPNPYAVEYGRFSAGLVVIQSRRAQDQWKFHINRFGPSIRSTDGGGFRIDSFNPRFAVGGPVVKDRVFLEQSAQLRYSVGDLASRPDGDQRTTKALSSFTRLDANISPRHFLVVTMGMFPAATEFGNVSTFTPPDASVDVHLFGKQLAVTERTLWTNRIAGETTVQWFESKTNVDPQGTAPMELQPDITLGNFFNRQHRQTKQVQVVEAVTVHRDGAGGAHVFKLGVDLLHTQYDGTSESHALLIERADGTVARRLDFSGASVQAVGSTEAAVFAQDRLQVNSRWSVEAGVRLDRDGVLGGVSVSPRIGTAVVLTASGKAVVRGGWGRFVERTPSMAGAFTSFERAVDTRVPAAGVLVTQTVAPGLQTAASRTWDATFDYRWNAQWAFRAGVLSRDGRDELIVAPVATGSGAERRLSSDGRSSYRDVEVGAHYTRQPSPTASARQALGIDVDATYTRSRSEGDVNALASSFDSVLAPIVGENVYTRLGTDVPHRLLVRGRVMPRPNWLLLGIFDWHTGVPYSIVNDTLDFVGARNELRFPTYSRLELGVERRFKIFRFQPWVGVRLTNALGQFLPNEVQNNTASPNFGTFYNPEARRVRLEVRFER
jgi:outer membrane receptor for ferrienterochelin and colicin